MKKRRRRLFFCDFKKVGEDQYAMRRTRLWRGKRMVFWRKLPKLFPRRTTYGLIVWRLDDVRLLAAARENR